MNQLIVTALVLAAVKCGQKLCYFVESDAPFSTTGKLH